MADKEKTTGPEAAKSASKVLKDGRTAKESKSAAGSALSKAGKGGARKRTGASAASAASGVVQDKDTSTKSKSAAGSTLSQAPSKKP